MKNHLILLTLFAFTTTMISCEHQHKTTIPLSKAQKTLKLFIPENYTSNFRWVKYADHDCQNYFVTTFSDPTIQSYTPDTVRFFEQLNPQDFARKNISIHEEQTSTCNEKTLPAWKNYLEMIYGNVVFEWSNRDRFNQATGYFHDTQDDQYNNTGIVYIIQDSHAFFIQFEDTESDSANFVGATQEIIKSIEVQ